METQFVLGTTARCSDGICGVVRRMILDPDTRTVTHLVIGPKHWSADSRLVPVALVEATAGDISLRCTMAEFGQLAPAEEVEVVGDIGFDAGMGIGMGVGAVPQAIIDDTVPPGETDLTSHERVHATDGEIGQIEGFVVNHDDHKVTHLLLKEGHLWGRKEVAIPVSAVASMENGIRLSITKREVEDLPALDRPLRHLPAQPLGVGAGVVRAERQAARQRLGKDPGRSCFKLTAEQVVGAGGLESQRPPRAAWSVDLGQFHADPRLRHGAIRAPVGGQRKPAEPPLLVHRRPAGRERTTGGDGAAVAAELVTRP